VAVKTKSNPVFLDPNNTNRIIVKLHPFTFYYRRVIGNNGIPCEPWIRKEAWMISGATNLGAEEYQSLATYGRWAFSSAINKAKELALQGKLF